MKFLQFLKTFVNKLEDSVLTNHGCLACRREILDGTKFSMCRNCLENIERITGNLCEKCGDIVNNENKFCDRCKNTGFSFSSSRSFAYYTDSSAEIIKRFKYSGKKYYGKYIAEFMFKNKKYFEGVDYLTFVPIGKKRKRERGFNQAEEMANELSKLSGIPVLKTLQKVGSEKHQAGLSQKQRQENLSGSFKLNDDIVDKIKGKVLMIVDDVFTTGATLSECAKVLSKNSKPKKIVCYTFAKTKFDSIKNG